MNKKQWYILAVGFFVCSWYLFTMASGWYCGFDTNADIICSARKYAYAIPAIITTFLAVMSGICGGFEK